MFKLLAEAGLKLKTKKCEFLENKLDYLGHTVSRGRGVAPNPSKVQSILNYPVPTILFRSHREISVREYYREVMDAYHRYLQVSRRILRAWAETATRALALREKKEEEANLIRN